ALRSLVSKRSVEAESIRLAGQHPRSRSRLTPQAGFCQSALPTLSGLLACRTQSRCAERNGAREAVPQGKGRRHAAEPPPHHHLHRRRPQLIPLPAEKAARYDPFLILSFTLFASFSISSAFLITS